MRVLITGSGTFYENLIGRLKREKQDIYTISDKNKTSGKTVNYEFDLSDKKLKFVIHSINPDAVIFLGATDERYDFFDEQVASMKYLSDLSNLLVTASSLNVKRFIYLSSSSVYGTGQNARVLENCEKKPNNIKSVIISQGESACLEFGKFSRMDCFILRFSEIYGLVSENSGESNSDIDFCNTIFDEVMKSQLLNKDAVFLPENEQLFSPIYVSDAVDAVYKVLEPVKKTLSEHENNSFVYNVSGNDAKLSRVYTIIKEIVSDSKADSSNNAIENITESEYDNPDNYDNFIESTIDSNLFRKHFGFRPIVEIEDGLRRMYGKLKKKIKKDSAKAKKNEKTGIFKIIAPFLENILVFAAFALFQLWTEQNFLALSEVNFMIFYIVIIAITFGLFQSAISVLLACLFLMLQNVYNGANLLDVLVDLNTIINILQYFIIGTICGYSKDRLHGELSEKQALLTDNKNELETIYKINDANIKIKQTLDERLTNHDDSLAKIYSVIEQLNSLQPDMVFFAAVNVIMDIMRSGDVSIYVITGGNFKTCRLMAKTPNPISAREHKVSIAFNDLAEMTEVVSRDEIFVNRDLKEDLPMMAAPVFSGRELVSLIMIWDIDFSDLTLYNINRFLVISRLISSVIERAYTHNQSMRAAMVLPETDILTENAFTDILKIYKEATEKNTTSIKTFLVTGINPETNQPLSMKELAEKLKSLLRVTDYIGVNPNNSNSLYALLTNMNSENFKQFVAPRFEKAGIFAEETEHIHSSSQASEEKSIQNAEAVSQNNQTAEVLPGTNILTEKSFLDTLNIQTETAIKNNTSICTFLASGTNPETSQPFSMKELAEKLNFLLVLHDNKYIGVNPKDYTSLYILLTDTDSGNFKQFVAPRLEKFGIITEEIKNICE